MVFRKTERGYIVRLVKGEKLKDKLTDFCSEKQIHSGVFYGIGAVFEAELGFYHLDRKEYSFKRIIKPLEIASLTGNIALVENKPFLHIHTVLSDQKFACFGGHLMEAVVGATCEIYLFTLVNDIERVLDNGIGLKLLNCNH